MDSAVITPSPAPSPLTEPVAVTQVEEATTLRWFERVNFWVPGLLLVISSIVMVVAYLGTPVAEGNRGLTNLTESFGALERVAMWQEALGITPNGDTEAQRLVFGPGFIAWSVRFAMVGMFASQAWAFWLAWRGTQQRPLWQWFVAPIAAHGAMLFLVPSNADVFFYEMSGHLASEGINPYAHALMEFPDNPLLAFNHWIEMTTVYGPLWTMINATIMRVTGPDPVLATFVYKVVLGLVALALGWVVYRFVRFLTPHRELAIGAAVLVLWQPNLLIETTGQAHNDPLMVLLATLAVAMVVAGGTSLVRGGVLIVTMSALIKYVSLPLLGMIALTRLEDRKRIGLPRILLQWFVDGLGILCLLVAAFLPFWNGPSTLKEMVTEPGRLFTNPIWFDPYLLFDYLLPHRIAMVWLNGTRAGMQAISIIIVLIVIVRFGLFCWHLADKQDLTNGGLPLWTREMLFGFAVIFTTLAMLPVNSHPWYWTWPIAPIAILVAYDARSSGNGVATAPPLPRWFWTYIVLTALMTLAYHTRIVHL